MLIYIPLVCLCMFWFFLWEEIFSSQKNFDCHLDEAFSLVQTPSVERLRALIGKEAPVAAAPH